MTQANTPLLILAPMAGITDWPFRLQARRQGAGLLVSEMISAMGLILAPRDNRANQNLLAFHPEEQGLLYAQVFGKDPDYMGRATEILSALPQYSGIDINCGCPAPKVTGSGSGSALMRDLPRARAIIRAVRKATSKPLSVKMRIGWDQHSINAVDFALLCQDEGVDSLCVHGRTRAQQYAGKADWATILQVKQALSIPVYANGDVFTPEDALNILSATGADGMAIGRGALGNPWLFAQIRQRLAGQPITQPSPGDIHALAVQHLEDLAAFKGEPWAVLEMRKHIGWYLRGSPGAAQTRAKVNRAEGREELLGLLAAHFSGSGN